MLVLPVDAVLLTVPVLWLPQYVKAVLATTVIAIALFSGGGRYRARLHLSVLDELPMLVGRLLVAAALVASVFALRHDGEGVETFLLIMLPGLGLVVLGRFVTSAFILAARRRGVVAHRTLVVGGGALAADVIEVLRRHPRYGLSVAGFLDDGEHCDASTFGPHLGALADLERVVAENDVDVVLVAGGEFDEAELLERVRSPECAALRPARRAPPPRLRHADRHRGPHRLGTDHADSEAAARRRQLGAQEGIRCPPRRGDARGARAGDGGVCACRAPGDRARSDLPSGSRRPR